MASFNSVQIKDIVRETPEAVTLFFNIPDSLKPEYKFLAGQYLTIETPVEGEKIRRDYSLSSTPFSGDVAVTVKRVENGKFSNYANSSLKIGDLVNLSSPKGKFILDHYNQSAKTIFAFAAGSGITPIISIIKTALEKNLNTNCVLLYGNKSPETTIFHGELKKLEQLYSNRFKLQLVFSQTKISSSISGRIDSENATNFLKNINSEQKKSSIFYLCGPEQMILDVKEVLLKNGVDEEKILYELFTASSSLKKQSQIAAPKGLSEATILFDDLSENITIKNNQTILDAALAKDIDVPYSCQGGVCSSCICKIKEGSAEMRQNSVLTDKEVKEGFVLSCMAVPTSAKLIVDFDDV